VRRRDFITLVSGAAAGWPLAAHAQQSAPPIVGYLSSFTSNARFNAGFNRGLEEMGFVDGQNVTVVEQYADGHYDQLASLAADLVRRPAAVIFAAGSNGPALAARTASTTIPIVFVSGGDPVQGGLVASLNRPGGNITGVTLVNTALLAKRLDLLRQLVPKAETIGVLINPTYPDVALQMREVQDAAASMGRKITVANAHTEGELEAAFASLVQNGAKALFTINDPYFNSLRSPRLLYQSRKVQ
jgi:putative ABC transport system substrate-binding protein